MFWSWWQVECRGAESLRSATEVSRRKPSPRPASSTRRPRGVSRGSRTCRNSLDVFQAHFALTDLADHVRRHPIVSELSLNTLRIIAPDHHHKTDPLL